MTLHSNTCLCTQHPPTHTQLYNFLGGPADGEQEPFEDEVGQLLGDNVEEEEEEEGEDLFGDNLERCVSDILQSKLTYAGDVQFCLYIYARDAFYTQEMICFTRICVS